jgi:phospholipid/cholesterol/gamma-HCH transport system substrate-binding protein
MNAAKENFLLKGYFNRKTRAAEKAKKDSLEKKAEEKKVIDKKKK